MIHMLQFLSPWLLAGAGAALVPLLIYLAQRRRAQRVVFGSVWFLRGLAQKIVRQRRTAEWFLLLLRMVILVLLAFAFARPVLLWNAEGDSAKGGIKAKAILLDTSGSMGIAGRMDDARRAAGQAVERLAPGDVVAIYTFGNNVAPLVGWTRDIESARTALADIKAGDTGSNLADALRRVQADILDRIEQDKEILIISDMQAVAWKSYQGDWTASPAVSLSFDDVGGKAEPPDNIGIVQVSVPRRTVLGSADEALNARLQNFTDTDQIVKLRLRLQGKPVAERTVPLAAESSQVVSFQHRFEEAGEIDGQFVLDTSDGYTPDNQAFFVVAVKPKIKILAVNGSPSYNPSVDGAYYVSKALAPSTESPFEIQEILPRDWQGDDLSGVSVVVLSDVADLERRALDPLKTFVEHGGGVMFFTGGKTEPKAFNRLFADIAPCRLDRRVKAADEDGSLEGVVFGEINTQHPCLHLFAQPHHGDFTASHFKQYFAVMDSQAATVLVRFSNNRPAVLIKAIGKGNAILIASSANQEMNDFSLHGVFVPFLQETAKFLAAAGGGHDTHAASGSEVILELPPEVTSAALIKPSGDRAALPVNERSVTRRSRSVTIPVVRFLPETAGIYRVKAGEREYLFAANTDPRESELRNMGSDEIAAALTSSRGVEDPGRKTVRVKARKAHREEIESRQRLGWYVLLAAAGLLLVEMIVADRITIRD